MPDDDTPQPDAPAPAAPPPAPPAWYGRPQRRRWPWIAVPVAVVVLATGGLVQHRLTTMAGTPGTAASAGPPAIVPAAPGEQPGFALVGAGDAVVYLQTETAVQRADLGSGAATLTPTPRLEEPSSFFAGPGWVASKTVGGPSGFLVRDGGGAQVLPVALQQAGRVYPRGTDDGVWVLPPQADRTGGRTAVLVDVAGDRLGDASIRVPGDLGLPIARLGSSLLAVTTQGTYEVGPAGSRRLSRGALLGVGTDAVLTWDCNTQKRCDARVNRPGKAPTYLPSARKSLQGLYRQDVASAAASRGVLSPDGRWVALQLPKPTRSGARLVLVKVSSGRRVEIPGAPADQNDTDSAAWTSNGRYLLALTDGRLRAFDSTTEKVLTVGGTPGGLRHLTIPGSATM